MFKLVVNQSKITLLLHSIVNDACKCLLLIFFNLVDCVPNLLLHLLSCLLVTSNHAFYFLGKGLLCVLELVFLQLVISKHLLDLSCVSLIYFAHVLLKLRVLFVFLHLEIEVSFVVRFHLLLLVTMTFFQL